MPSLQAASLRGCKRRSQTAFVFGLEAMPTSVYVGTVRSHDATFAAHSGESNCHLYCHQMISLESSSSQNIV